MKRSGPDSLSSWMIAAACCIINMMMYGMARLSGVLFVASVPKFNVPREKASFPYTFANFMRNTSGPLVGYLGHRFGVRAVTTFGSLLGAAGAGACFLATDIDTVTVLWGAVFGLGFGLGNILLPVAINQYFDKKRSTASGISFSGACIGSFLLPPVVEVLLNNYGLSGTYLFLAGFILNCVPAALLLKKPSFTIQEKQGSDNIEDSEKQSITSGMKVKLYTVENTEQKHFRTLQNKQQVYIPNIVVSNATTQPSKICEGTIRSFSTDAGMPSYFYHMSATEHKNINEIKYRSRSIEQLKICNLEVDTSSQSQDSNLSSKSEVSESDFRSSSLQHEKPITLGQLSTGTVKAVSSESLQSLKNEFYTRLLKFGQQNYAYQSDQNSKPDSNLAYIPPFNMARRTYPQCGNKACFHSGTCKKKTNNFKDLHEKYKCCNVANVSQSSETPSYNNTKSIYNCDSYYNGMIKNEEAVEAKGTSPLGVFNIIFDPMFILIAITNSIYTFTFVCMITIIVDYARDINIGLSNEKYILMTLSVGDLIGRLGFGWVTDGGYMTKTGFISLCFALQGLFTGAIVWSDGFFTLMSLATLYGLSEAGIIVIFPVIIAQFIEPDKQTVAISSSHFLSGPLCLTVAPLIGYFRDNLGSYDYMFFMVAILSFACSLSWMLTTCIRNCRKAK